MAEVDHVKADLREHTHRRAAAQDQRRRAQEEAAAAEHRLAAAMRRVLDAGGIITDETEKIDKLLERLAVLLPRQRESTE